MIPAKNAKLTFKLMKRLAKKKTPDTPKRMNKGGEKVIKPKKNMFQFMLSTPLSMKPDVCFKF